MKFILTDEEYSLLIKEGFVSIEDNYLIVKLISYLTDNVIEIAISKEITEAKSSDDPRIEIKEVTNLSSKTLQDFEEPYYNDFINFKSNFPMSDKFGTMKSTRVLRSDKHYLENGVRKSKAFDNYRKALEYLKYTPEELLNIMLFEVTWRKGVTYRDNNGNNKLTYMSGLMPWLNDHNNITLMKQMMEEDKANNVQHDTFDDFNSSNLFTDL